jgi:lipopolysaccharide biosynthesis glycosyltransferase
MIHIAVNIDENYVKHCGVLLISIFENNRNRQFSIHILCDHLSEESKNVLSSIVEGYGGVLTFYDITIQSFENFPVSSQWPITIYYRLLIPSLLSDNINRVLYLDCDIIVKGSLDELWNSDLDEFAVGAVEDELSPISAMIERLGYDSKYGYFNSGVLLLNLYYWRKNNISKKCVDYIYSNMDNIFHPDQDALNAILHDKWLSLEYRWNFISSYQRLYFNRLHLEDDFKCISIKFPVIIHFTGKKPWDSKCRSHFKLDYFYYLEQSPWKCHLPKHSFVEYVIHFGIILSHRLGLFRVRINYKF